jgi:peptidoglycan/xylan/chitin deacetylase (PgdA/CDA1 family)
VDPAYYLRERYVTTTRQTRSLTLYYRCKPLMPRRVQLAARRLHARRARRRHETDGRFPRWPIEPVLAERREEMLRAADLHAAGRDAMPLVAPWPAGHRFAYVLTHDVEGPRGVANIDRVLDIERRYGVVSSWNFVADDYDVKPIVFDVIRAAGGEIGLHGLHHDGRLFESRAHFERQLPAIHRYLRAWGAEGFRSPATHRNPDWMPELGCSYDSSFPDTDPFEPQPGGCCSILPYFLGEIVELPITLVQDHTLFEILRERDIGIWRAKATWIARHGGLVTVLVHPDYMLDDERLRRYEELLELLAALEDGWHALPRDVARWWRLRHELQTALARHGELDEAALSAAHARIEWLQEREGPITMERGKGPL